MDFLYIKLPTPLDMTPGKPQAQPIVDIQTLDLAFQGLLKQFYRRSVHY
jgi:hypothetical protein